MTTNCYQLSINEREKISLGLAQELSKNYIALSLGRHFNSPIFPQGYGFFKSNIRKYQKNTRTKYVKRPAAENFRVLTPHEVFGKLLH